MQRLGRQWLVSGVKTGFVPTMGALHAGHLSLAERARAIVGPRGKVVLSIYVNPTQFGPKEDFTRYPRDLQRDADLCRRAGVDIIFAPETAELYPSEGGEAFSTFVVEESLSQAMEGAARPGHFRGVTTIVAKLLNIVGPEVVVFGQKDFQQAAVVKRIIRDLNFPVRIVVAATVREADGLAMSSRNRYLSPDERQQAVALWQAIQLARRKVGAAKRRMLASSLGRELHRAISRHPVTRVDYISFFDPSSLQPVRTVGRGTQLALAVFVGRTRLIDNARL